jgi:hypothetical protein
MTYLVPFAGIFAVTLLLVRFKARVTRRHDGWRFELRYGKFALLDTADGRRRKRRGVRRKSRTRKREFPVVRFIEMVPGSIRAAARGLRFLLERVRLDRCIISGTLEASDPAETGYTYALLSALDGLLETRFPKVEIALVPEFMHGGTQLWFEGEASIRTAALVAFPFVVLFHLPKKALAKFAMESLRR